MVTGGRAPLRVALGAAGRVVMVLPFLAEVEGLVDHKEADRAAGFGQRHAAPAKLAREPAHQLGPVERRARHRADQPPIPASAKDGGQVVELARRDRATSEDRRGKHVGAEARAGAGDIDEAARQHQHVVAAQVQPERPRAPLDQLAVLELGEREIGKAGFGQEDEERLARGRRRLRRARGARSRGAAVRAPAGSRALVASPHCFPPGPSLA